MPNNNKLSKFDVISFTLQQSMYDLAKSNQKSIKASQLRRAMSQMMQQDMGIQYPQNDYQRNDNQIQFSSSNIVQLANRLNLSVDNITANRLAQVNIVKASTLAQQGYFPMGNADPRPGLFNLAYQLRQGGQNNNAFAYAIEMNSFNNAMTTQSHVFDGTNMPRTGLKSGATVSHRALNDKTSNDNELLATALPLDNMNQMRNPKISLAQVAGEALDNIESVDAPQSTPHSDAPQAKPEAPVKSSTPAPSASNESQRLADSQATPSSQPTESVQSASVEPSALNSNVEDDDSVLLAHDGEYEDVQNALGQFLTPTNLQTIQAQMQANPDLKFSSQSLTAARKELKALYNLGQDFSIRPGAKPGQFDASLAGPAGLNDRILDASDSRYIGRIYAKGLGTAFVSSSQDVGADVGTLLNYFSGQYGFDKNGRYVSLSPSQNFSGSTYLRRNVASKSRSSLFMNPLSNTNPDTQAESKFLDGRTIDYSPEEGTRVANYYLSEARNQYFQELSMNVPSNEDDVNDDKEALNEYLETTPRNGLNLETNSDDFDNQEFDWSQSIANSVNIDEYKQQVFKVLQAESVIQQRQYVDATHDQYRTHHEVSDHDFQKAQQQERSYQDFLTSLQPDENAIQDVKDFKDTVSALADNRLGELSENVEDQTIEPNRVVDFANRVHSLSTSNDMVDAMRNSPLINHLIGPDFSQNLVKDRAVKFNEETGNSARSLIRQQVNVGLVADLLQHQSDDKALVNPDVLIDDHNVIQFEGKDSNGVNHTGAFTLAQFDKLTRGNQIFFDAKAHHRDEPLTDTKVTPTDEIQTLFDEAQTPNAPHFDSHFSRDEVQLHQLANILDMYQNDLYSGGNGVMGSDGLQQTPLFYHNAIIDENGRTVKKSFNVDGVTVNKNQYHVGINPNGLRVSSLKDVPLKGEKPDADGNYRLDQLTKAPNLPDVQIDRRGVVRWSGYRSIGFTTGRNAGQHNITDRNGTDIYFEYNNDSNQWEPIKERPTLQKMKTKSGKEVYRFKYSSKVNQLLRQNKIRPRSMQDASVVGAMPVFGHYGQIFVPDKHHITTTQLNSEDNFAFVGQGNAYFLTDHSDMTKDDYLSTKDRFRVINSQHVQNEYGRSVVRGQLQRPVANIPENQTKMKDELIDDEGNIKALKGTNFNDLQNGKFPFNSAVDVSSPTENTSVNKTYQDSYGQRLIEDFWNKSKLPEDLKAGILETLALKVRFPNMYRENSTTLSFNQNQGYNPVQSGIHGITGNNNLRQSIDDLKGYLDNDMTSSGKQQGIAHYLVQGVKFNPDNSISPAETPDEKIDLDAQSPLMKTQYFKYSKNSPWDRIQMASHQALTAQSMDKDTHVMLSTFGGFTFDDSTVISKAYAEKHSIDVGQVTDKTMQWFERSVDNYAENNDNLGNHDWGKDTKRVLSTAAPLREDLQSATTDWQTLVNASPDNFNVQRADFDDDLAYQRAQYHAKEINVKKQIKKYNRGDVDLTDLGDDFLQHATEVQDHLADSTDHWNRFSDKYATTRPLTRGDKLSEFGGNKATIGLVVDPDMSPEEAKAKDIETEFKVFHQNPKLDMVMSPNSLVSRNNMGVVKEMQDKMQDNDDIDVKLDGQSIGQWGRLNTLVTDISADSKTHVYHQSDAGRKFSSQLIWALQQHGASNVVKEAFSDNDRAWHDFREYLLATGYDMSSTGEFQKGFNPHPKEHRKVFELAQPGDDVNDMSKVSDGEDFFRKMQGQGGLLQLPFEVKTLSGQTTDQLPVLSASLRKNTQQVDGGKIINDYSNDYGGIVDAAQKYNKAKADDKSGDELAKIQQDCQQKVSMLQNKLCDDQLGGMKGKSNKHSFVREHLIARRLLKSATSVWTADPRVDIDTIKISPEMYKEVGPRDENGKLIPFDEKTGRPTKDADKRVMLWRDPCLHAGSVRSFKLQVDPDITGVGINPVNDKPFDGDFDGDTVGIMRFDGDAAQEDLKHMSVPNNLIAPSSELDNAEDVTKIDSSHLSSQLNCSMDFVSGFKNAVEDPSGLGLAKINDVLGEGHELTAEDLGQKVDKDGHTTGESKPVNYKKLLNKTLVSIALNNDSDTAMQKSNDLVHIGMRDYNFGSAKLRYDSIEHMNKDIKFQQENGIKGKPGKMPVMVQNGENQGEVVMQTPKDPVTGEEMFDYMGFSPKTKLNPETNKLDYDLDDNGEKQWVRDRITDKYGVEHRGMASAMGKCKVFYEGLKDATNDPQYGDGFANSTRDIQAASGIKTDDTGVAGKFSQDLFATMRTVNPAAALEVTYPITQATLQIKHDASKAALINTTLNGPLKNLYDGHHADYSGPKDKKHEHITKDEWCDELQDIYVNKLDVDLDMGYVHQLSDVMSDENGQMFSQEELMDNKAAQIDRISFGQGLTTIDDMANCHDSVMGPSHDVIQKARQEHGLSDDLTERMPDELVAELNASPSNANQMAPSSVQKTLQGIADGVDQTQLPDVTIDGSDSQMSEADVQSQQANDSLNHQPVNSAGTNVDITKDSGAKPAHDNDESKDMHDESQHSATDSQTHDNANDESTSSYDELKHNLDDKIDNSGHNDDADELDNTENDDYQADIR